MFESDNFQGSMDAALQKGKSKPAPLFLFAILLLATGFHSQAYGILNTEWNYDKCSGNMSIKYHLFRSNCSTCDDDWLNRGTVYYKTTAGAWVKIFTEGDAAISNCTGTHASDGFFRYLTLNGRPGDAAFPIEFRFEYWWANRGGQGDAEDYGNHYSGQMFYQNIDAPVNVTASYGTRCNDVQVSWSAPVQGWQSSAGCSNNGTYTYDVLVNGNFVGNTNLTSFNVTGLTRGVNYNIFVVTKWKPASNNFFNIWSAVSNTAQGRLTDPPPVATGFAATRTLCNGTVQLSWDWNYANPQNGFNIWRYPSAGNTWQRIGELGGGSRSFVNDANTNLGNVVKNVNYEYAVVAINECGLTSEPPHVYGLAPDIPARPDNINIFIDSVNNKIVLNWRDNAVNETRYTVERSIVGGAGSTLYDVDANATSFVDEDVNACVNYRYVIKVYNDCLPLGQPALGTYQTRLTPNLANTFDNGFYKLKASKGYYGDRVELAWNNRNNAQLNNFRIFRKAAGTQSDSTLIGSVSAGTGVFFDNSAIAGVLYKYSIIGETQCVGQPRYSNLTEDYGFRSPSGVINGTISYLGGFGASDVKVLAQSTSSTKGGSLFFNGSNGALLVPHLDIQNPATGNITIEAWVKPITKKDFNIVSKSDVTNGGYRFIYNGTADQLEFSIMAPAGSSKNLIIANPFIALNAYNQLTATFNGDSLIVYINGNRAGALQAGGIVMGASVNMLTMGGIPAENIYGHGYLDETRIWKIAKSAEQVSRDYNRTVDPNNALLIAYWTFDEHVTGLTRFFDQSNLNLVYNENHGSISGALFSDTVPSTSQLALASYTDASGNYTINNVRYLGTGQNFTVTPASGIHTFSPSNKVMFIGEGSQVQNNIDFTDNSSFEFTGNVKYAGTSCPAKGASVLIDGQIAILNNLPVIVNDSGKFNIRVPIGNHVVSLSEADHIFSQGRFPPVGFYNFMSPVAANFVDSTLVKVVGRVVGGLKELNKVPGLGRSKNNIGKAQFTFASVGVLGVNNCYIKNVVTDDVTGEYTAYLFPMRYAINGLKLVNNPDPTLLTQAQFNNPNLLDLSEVPQVIHLTDTFRADTFSRVDELSYHKRLDFKYFVTPKIFVSKASAPFDSLINNFSGETKLELPDSAFMDISNNDLGYPVFIQSKYYSASVKVVEVYTNIDRLLNDPARLDRVRVPGTLKFFNDLATPDDTVREVQIDDGLFNYTFRAGIPNQLRNSLNPAYSFTKTFQLEFVPSLGITVNWKPNEADVVSRFYRAYVFGSKGGGANFTSSGPALVDFILHDPPGSASSSTWSSGKTFTTTESWNLANAYGSGASATLHLGTKSETQVGVPGATVTTEFEAEHNISVGVNFSKSINEDGELVTTTSNTTTISTGSDPGSVGSSADIYYGKTTNIIFGNSDVIELIDTATCKLLQGSLPDPVCYGPIVNGHQVGRREGFYIVPGQVKSTFAYTQNEILELIIPDLEVLRNQYLTKNILNNRGQRKYVPVFSDPQDPDYDKKFASNNDDPLWGTRKSTPNPFIFEAGDTMGASYHFRGNSLFETDSIRYYNNQIRLWKNAIARNEANKYRIFKDSGSAAVAGGRNISIGMASLTEDFSTQVDNTYTESFEWNISEEMAIETGFAFNKHGASFALGATFEQTRGGSKSTTTTVANTYSYTLQDGDAGDLISVDVVDPKDGNSHIFKLRAGRTSCPYEGREQAMFYNPENDTLMASTFLENGVELHPATAQNDVPVINVQQRSIYNVPAADEAVFVLELGNLSEGGQDRTYKLKVNEASNPYGAIIKVDGLDPNREFDVPYGTTLQKTLTIKRGPINYDYNNIELIFSSGCDDDISDAITVSARFLPTCTGIELKAPDDRWVLNNSFNDTLPVLIGGYNYNYGGFQAVHFQYKPGSTNTWFGERSFFKDTANDAVKIPVGSPDVYYPFSFKNLPDGNYELRAVTECIAPGYPNARINSTVMQGLVDRVNPTPFGTPSPGDGILSPNDDISIQFNEAIDQSSLSPGNFDIKGILNKTSLRSNTSLYFDGDGDYLEVPAGLNLQRQSFTIEFWHKRGTTGEQVLFSQGADDEASFAVGFNHDNKLYFRIGDETVMANTAMTDTTSFNFYAVAYNSDLQVADLLMNETTINTGNNRMFTPYEGAGKFLTGKSCVGEPSYANGNIYEVRIWNRWRSLTEVNTSKSALLNGSESGLVANWRMDEATGNIVKDYARSRNASIANAQWFLFPMGSSYAFHGNGDYVSIPSGHFGMSREMDFTIEFWFKGNNGNAITLLSNGKGSSSDSSAFMKWRIGTNTQGQIVVNHNSNVFTATNSNYFDNTWHHLAFVMKRSSNFSCYVDGVLQNAVQANNFGEFGGAKLWFGARGWNNQGLAGIDSTDGYFTGKLDELRIWTSARLAEQLGRDKNNRLTGSEAGLVLYVPFESYQEIMGFPVLAPTTLDVTSVSRSFTAWGSASSSTESPTVKLPRPVQAINFSYAVNNDKIIITPLTANEFIENVTLDITVKDIKDLHGNKLQSPKTWIAYIDKNQVKWQDDERSFVKQAGQPLTFNATIINSGGALKAFAIANLPAWLNASPAAGNIQPNSSMSITFTVDPTVNIGSYEQDLALKTDFGFDDKLIVRLKVYAVPPSWNVNTAAYAKSMSIIGQVRINNVISSNSDDMLSAFVNNECRGVAHVTYNGQLDKYLVFMDLYGVNEGEQIEFRIWNAAQGKIHADVQPSLQFQSDGVVGAVLDPQVFNALNRVITQIPVRAGWNWISFNLLMGDSANFTQLFSGLNPASGTQLKNNTEMAMFDANNGWMGNLANISAGVKPEKGYLLYSLSNDTLSIKGNEANPLLRPLSLTPGWNYIGFVSQRNMTPGDAFTSFNPASQDLVKGQTKFAVYDPTLGWVGSLTSLKPNEGYLYKTSKTGTFMYPRSGMFGKKEMEGTADVSKHWLLNPYPYSTSMNMVAKVNVCSELLQSGGWLLGAFVNGELRGFVKPTKISDKTYLYFLSIAGNTGEEISFKLLDEGSGTEYTLNENASYDAGTLSSSMHEPVSLTGKVSIGCSPSPMQASALSSKVYPVPVSDKLSIEINLPAEDNVTIRVLDVSGKEVSMISNGSFDKGKQGVSWEAGAMPAGIYIIEIATSTQTMRHKVIRL